MSVAGPWVVLGGTGQLGAALAAHLRLQDRRAVLPTRAELDLSDTSGIASRLHALRPSVVVNAAAFTDVARAELAESCAEAYLLNRDAPAALAEACRAIDVPFVHVSTDYVFDGARRTPYREDDPVHPLQVYGASKLAGETEVLRTGGRSLIVRTSTLFGPATRARLNYVDAILEQARRGAELQVVELPVASPTFAPDLARGILALVERGAEGVVHVTNRGQCSRLELARAVVEEAGLAVEVRTRPPVPGVPRPEYSVLDTARFESWTGVSLPTFQEAVAAHIRARTS